MCQEHFQVWKFALTPSCRRWITLLAGGIGHSLFRLSRDGRGLVESALRTLVWPFHETFKLAPLPHCVIPIKQLRAVGWDSHRQGSRKPTKQYKQRPMVTSFKIFLQLYISVSEFRDGLRSNACSEGSMQLNESPHLCPFCEHSSASPVISFN